MVFTHPVTVSKKKKPLHLDHQNRIRRAGGFIMAAVAIVLSQALEGSEKIPMHTSVLTGRLWLDELLEGLCQP